MHYLLVVLVLPILALKSPSSEEEGLYIRRIEKLIELGEKQAAKLEIEDFLAHFPKSPYANKAHEQLGDIALQNDNYPLALKHYNSVATIHAPQALVGKQALCLYQLQRYAPLKELLAPQIEALDYFDKEEKEALTFFYAEALFYEASLFFEKGVRLTEAKRLLRRALPHYLSLKDSHYHLQAKLAAAKSATLLKNTKEGARRYLALAKEVQEAHPELAEKLTFEGALLTAHFDTKKALYLLATLTRTKGAKAPKAALYWMRLLYKSQAYSTLIQEAPLILATIEKPQVPLCHARIGWAYLQQKHLALGQAHLEKALQGGLTPKEEAPALLALMKCAQGANDAPSFEKAFGTYQEKYDDNIEGVIKAKTMRAHLFLQNNQEKLAELELLTVQKVYGSQETSSVKEALSLAKLELCKLYLHQNRFEKCREGLLTLLENNEEKHVLALLPIATLKQLKNTPSPQKKQPLYENLVADLKRALDKNIYPPHKAIEHEITLARALLSLSEVQKAHALLKKLSTKAKDPKKCASIYYLLSHCSLILNVPKEAAAYGEKALNIDPSLKELRTLHLNLFNAYLSFDDKRAANHLFLALKEFPKEQSTEPISLQNLIWLANYYYQDALAGKNTANTRALFVFEHLLGRHQKRLILSKHLLFLEEEVLKLATLYTMEGAQEKRTSLLEELLSWQLLHPNWDWQERPATTLQLATSYADENKIEEALELLHQIEKEKSPSISFATTLALARLEYQELVQKKAPLTKKALAPILKKLGVLVLKKRAQTEPMHLEAAIDKAFIETAFAPKSERPQRLSALFRAIKEEFLKQDDIPSKDYHAALAHLPKQKELFLTYLRFIDAMLLDSAEQKAALLSLKQQRASLTPYLQKKIEELHP